MHTLPSKSPNLPEAVDSLGDAAWRVFASKTRCIGSLQMMAVDMLLDATMLF
jgi:hypothetical protein